MGFGPKIEKYYPRRKHDTNECAALRLVYGIVNTTSEDAFITIEDINPG